MHAVAGVRVSPCRACSMISISSATVAHDSGRAWSAESTARTPWAPMGAAAMQRKRRVGHSWRRRTQLFTRRRAWLGLHRYGDSSSRLCPRRHCVAGMSAHRLGGTKLSKCCKSQSRSYTACGRKHSTSITGCCPETCHLPGGGRATAHLLSCSAKRVPPPHSWMTRRQIPLRTVCAHRGAPCDFPGSRASNNVCGHHVTHIAALRR